MSTGGSHRANRSRTLGCIKGAHTATGPFLWLNAFSRQAEEALYGAGIGYVDAQLIAATRLTPTPRYGLGTSASRQSRRDLGWVSSQLLTASHDGELGVEGRDHAADLLDQTECARYPSEAVVQVEPGGILMECVDHREAGGDEFRGNSHPPESVGQDGPTKTLAPQTCIDREAASRTAGTSAGLPRPRLLGRA